MKKIVGIFVCTLLIIMSLPVITAINMDVMIKEEIKSVIKGDELDQYMIELNIGFPIGNYRNESEPYYNWTIAQSFKPSKMILTRIQLFLARNTTPPTIYPLIIAIRENLLGDNLKFISINPGDITEYPDGSWIECDFDDFLINVGETYYIVCYTTNETDNAYIWGANSKNGYANGQAYYSLDDGQTWSNDPPMDLVDMCFMTFGRDNNRPYSPLIDGPQSGGVGIIHDYDFTNCIDPDGDDMTYHVEWGDGGVDEGFVESGGAFTLSHSWSRKADYTIKAKLIDDYGAESGWAKFDVNIPRPRTSQFKLFYSLFSRFTNLFPILKILLQRLG